MSLSVLFANLRDVCLFRRGPEDMPYVPRLLVALVAGCVALQVLLDLHQGLKPTLAAAAVVGGLATLAVVWQLLRGRGKPERFVQTATALSTVYLLFGLAKGGLTLLLPVRQWRAQFMADPSHLPEPTGHQTLVALAVTILGVWQLCVWIGILRRALDTSVAGGVLVFLLLGVVSMTVAVLVAALLGAALVGAA